MNNHNNTNNNNVENADNVNNNTHSINHAIAQLSSSNPYNDTINNNNTPTNNHGFNLMDNNVFNIPNPFNNGNAFDGNPGNLSHILNNDNQQSNTSAPTPNQLAEAMVGNLQGDSEEHSSQNTSGTHSGRQTPQQSEGLGWSQFSSMQGTASSKHANPTAPAIEFLNTLIEAGNKAEKLMFQSTDEQSYAAAHARLTKAQDIIDSAKATLHRRYPNGPAYFPPGYEVDQGTANSKQGSGNTKAPKIKLPKDLPHLHTYSTRNMDVNTGTKEFPTAEAWVRKLADGLFYKGIDESNLNELWPRVIRKVLDSAQQERLTSHLRDVPIQAGNTKHTWKQVWEAIPVVFDTVSEERRLQLKVIHCYQQRNESIATFVQRFASAVYDAKLDRKDSFVCTLMLENMRSKSREAAIAHLNINRNTWPKDFEKVCQTLANFTTPDNELSSGFKRQRVDDQPQQSSFNGSKKFKQQSTRLPHECKHCWNHERKHVAFNKDHQCPHDPRKKGNTNCAACRARAQRQNNNPNKSKHNFLARCRHNEIGKQ